MRRSAWLYGLSRLGAECQSAEEAFQLLLRELSWRMPSPMSVHVRMSEAIMPAPRSQHTTYCRFRCAYRKVARMQPADTACSGMVQCMACDDTDSPRMHDTCECACDHDSSVSRRDGASYIFRRDGASYVFRRDGANYIFRRDGANPLPRRDGAQNIFPPQGQCFDTLSLRTAVICHMQRKLLGYCLEKIYKAQDYMATFCYEDHRGFLTEETKRKVVQLNYALAPWYKMVGTITTHKRLQDVVT